MRTGADAEWTKMDNVALAASDRVLVKSSGGQVPVCLVHVANAVVVQSV